MKLLLKQRFFSWFDSYDIYDESGNTVYVVKGQMAWGHCLKIFDIAENELGMIKQQIFAFLPKFEIYKGGNYIGCIKKEFSLFKPVFDIDYNGWHMEGNFWEWVTKLLQKIGTNLYKFVQKDRFFIEQNTLCIE